MSLFLALLSQAGAHVPLDIGDWTITELHAGPAEEGGQWFEVRNNDESDGNNLTEQSFEDVDGDSFTILGNAIAHEGEYVVIASEGGSVEADAYFPATFDLRPEAGAITLFDHTTGPVDTVAWDAAWAVEDGAAFAVNPGIETSAWANDLAANWCAATATPGAVNAWCTGSAADDDGDGQAEQDGDCDDTDAGHAEGMSELACDGLDQDCDGLDLCMPDTAGDTAANGVKGGAGHSKVGTCGCGAAPSSPDSSLVLIFALTALRRRATLPANAAVGTAPEVPHG